MSALAGRAKSKSSSTKRTTPANTRPRKLVNSLSAPSTAAGDSTRTVFSSSIKPTSSFLAHLSPSPSLATPHLLRIFDAADAGRCTARWAPAEPNLGDGGVSVTALEWVLLPALSGTDGAQDGSKRGKKRKKSETAVAEAIELSSAEETLLLAIGSSDGSISLLDPAGGRLRRTLISGSSDAVISLAFVPASPNIANSASLWSLSSSSLLVFDLSSTSTSPAVTLDLATIPGLGSPAHLGSIAVRALPSATRAKANGVNVAHGMEVDSDDEPEDDVAAKSKINGVNGHATGVVDGKSGRDGSISYDVLLGSTAIFHLSVVTSFTSSSVSANLLATLTGHVTLVSDLVWLPATMSEDSAFLSIAKDDRHLQLWVLDTVSSSGQLRADFAAPAELERMFLGPSSSMLVGFADRSGGAGILDLSLALANQSPAKDKKKKKARPIVKLETSVSVIRGQILDAGFVEADKGESPSTLRVARGGVKPVFELLSFRDELGAFIPSIELESRPELARGYLVADDVAAAGAPIQPARYVESTSTRISNAHASTSSGDNLLLNDAELDVDIDTDGGPTLAERLKGLQVVRGEGSVGKRKAKRQGARAGSGDDEDEEDDTDADGHFDSDLSEEEDAESSMNGLKLAPSATLTQTLIQALHSNDTRLLEACLSHANPPLIRATLARLQPHLVLRLVEALVERLSRGRAGFAAGKGGPGAQRARALVEWVKGCLVVHMSFLVTVPSLVDRLSSLHATLTARLATRDKLTALSGRLELIMSQIEAQRDAKARSASAAEATRPRREPRRYVEGETSESDEDVDEDDEAEIEDVVLGGGVRSETGESDSEEFSGSDSDEVSEDEDDEDDEDDEPPIASGRRARAGSSASKSPKSASKGKKVNGIPMELDLEAMEELDSDEEGALAVDDASDDDEDEEEVEGEFDDFINDDEDEDEEAESEED